MTSEQGAARPPQRVALCIPTVTRPFQQCLDAIEASAPLLDAAGLDHRIVFEVGNPYISAARATMLRKAMDAKADVVVFIDHDLSWKPSDLLTLIETPGDVVAGLYRFKTEPVEYMGAIDTDASDRPLVVNDLIRATKVPAGFLKVTKEAVGRFMSAYPELCYGPKYAPAVDLFNHGAHEGVWWGEDYAFSRRWRALGGDIWVIPGLDLTHHDRVRAYPGNFHDFLRRQPGGDLAEA